MGVTNEYDRLLFNVQRSARYHDRREAFYNFLSNVALFLGAIYGSAAAVAFIEKAGGLTLIVSGFIVSVATGVSLVAGSGSMARQHAVLRRRFVDLEREIELARGSWTDDDLAELTGERLLIEAEEPPVRRILSLIVYNEQLQAQGYKRTDLVKIPWWQTRIAHFSDLGADRLEDAKV